MQACVATNAPESALEVAIGAPLASAAVDPGLGGLVLDGQYFHALLEAAPDAIIIVNEAGEIVLVNAQAESLFGYSRDELIRQPVELLLPPRYRAAHLRHRAVYGKSPQARAMGTGLDLAARHRDGHEFPVEVSLSPVATNDGSLVISAVRDVTGQRAAERAAIDANRLKDEFLATLSHELRTPLNAILGWSTMLASGSGAVTSPRRAAASIARCAQQLHQLVNDLLDVSRIVTGKLRLDMDPVGLRTIVLESIETVRAAIEAKRMELQVELIAPDVVVLGDASRLRQVIWNLLSNAVKYTPECGRILVRLDCVGSSAIVVVADNGQGMSPEFLPFAFDRFRQANSGPTREVGGMGLGLSIVQQLVELHGGTVKAESDGIDRGTTLTMTLPALPVTAIADRRSSSWARLTGNDITTASECPDLRGVLVLIVDADRETAELVTAIVELAGASTVIASDVSEAVAILDRVSPDVIVCDMAAISGTDTVVHELRRGERPDRRVPAIALTTDRRAEDRRRHLLAGFQGELIRPPEPRELVAMIASLVGRTGVGRCAFL